MRRLARLVHRRPAPSFSACLLPFLLAGLATASGADTARRGERETALDRYVAAPDAAFRWNLTASVAEPGVTGYALEMFSQHWLTPAEVNRPEWRHWLLIVKPEQLAHRTALLFISGGSNRPGPPPRPSRELIEIARSTRSVVAELRMVPNQSLIFGHDGRERKEDDLIAYSWIKYLRTGDERWPARLPMTKAAVRAMDAVTAFLASEAGGGAPVESFVVSGASKRGWTAWTTASVDQRVIALCPVVIDVLNTEVSMVHHHRAYGFFAPAVGDYVAQGVMAWTGTPELRALYAIEDPFSYRDRLTMPKLIINATGDQFFVPDSSQFYFGQLPGANYLRYIPNTDHSLKNSDAFRSLQAWHHAILTRAPLPRFSWQHPTPGRVVVTAETEPKSVRLWQATNPAARDFRLETLGPKWTAQPITGQRNTFEGTVVAPDQGWTAYFMELTFEQKDGPPLVLTTDVAVTPTTLPFAAPTAPQPQGFLNRTPGSPAPDR